MQQRAALQLLPVAGEHVPPRYPFLFHPVHLLTAGIEDLGRGQLDAILPRVGHQLVDDVQAGRVRGHAQGGPHAKLIDGSFLGEQPRDELLVQVAAGDDLHALQSRIVQHLPRRA